MKHDAESRQKLILDYYRLFPKETVQKVADHIGLSVAQTTREMEELAISGALTRKVVVNLNKLGLRHKYRIDVRLNPRELQENADVAAAGAKWKTANPQEMLAHYLWDEYSQDNARNPELIFENATILLGDPADLSLTIRVRDPRKLYEFITTKLRSVLGIENTSTCTEAWAAADHRNSQAPAPTSPAESGGGTVS